MVQNTNFSNANQNDYVQYTNDSTSLLTKYDLPITHLDFSYVEKCADAKILEKIYHVLLSGQEGYYPELMEAVEKKLQILYPSSKFLRKYSKVISRDELDQEEWKILSNDLNDWVEDITKNDKELVLRKGGNNPHQPEIRQIRTLTEAQKNATNKKRIASTDYASWDKYDPDTELLKMTLEEEKMTKKALEANNVVEKQTKKKVKFNKFSTKAEAVFEAKREKEKGNELFKIREYDSALIHYTSSLECNATVECYNNRALTFIKMNKYQEALSDLDLALLIEPDNIKTLYRKVLALEGLKRYEDALICVVKCIKIDPNDVNIQALADKMRKKFETNVVEKRIVVEEIENETKEIKKNRNGILKKFENIRRLEDEVMKDKKEERIVEDKIEAMNRKVQYDFVPQREEPKVIVPIPGTSKMSEPFYVTCNVEDIQYTVDQINNRTQKINTFIAKLTQEEEECSVDHLKHICSKENLKIDEKEASSEKINRRQQQSKEILQDKEAGGEPCPPLPTLPESIYSPFTFLKTWKSIGNDPTYRKYAFLIKNMNMDQLEQVIGCKLDNEMFSIILKTLYMHFTVAGEVEKIYSVLMNVRKLPRFEIIAMLMSDQDKNYINMLIGFLNQHDKPLLQYVVEAFNS